MQMIRTVSFGMTHSRQNFINPPRSIAPERPLLDENETFYKKNAIIFNEGEHSNSAYIIRSGRVKIFLKNARGKIIVLGELGAGECFGEMALLDENECSASAMAMEDTVLTEMGPTGFRECMRSDPDMAERITLSLVAELRKAHAKISDLVFVDVQGRVENLLLALAEERGEQFVIKEKPSQQHIANVVGASRECVARIFKKMIDAGHLSIAGKQIIITRRLGNSA
jgi:CRP/FNR family cyclic AMP-dependent transcriptional regulator